MFGGCSANIEVCLEDGSCGPAINVANLDGNLPEDPYDPFWDSKEGPASINIELGPQMITNPKWPNPSTRQVLIRAVKNIDELVVLLEWEDITRDGNLSLIHI